MSSPLLNAEQVAEVLGIKASTVLRWQREGIIPTRVKQGRVIRFDEEEVRQALSQPRQKTAQVPTC